MLHVVMLENRVVVLKRHGQAIRCLDGMTALAPLFNRSNEKDETAPSSLRLGHGPKKPSQNQRACS